MTEPQRYRAYLLRLWQSEDERGRRVWRAALEDVRTSERHGFADLERLCAFLEARTSAWSEAASPAPDHEAGEGSTESQ
jgi:hypothetical protein